MTANRFRGASPPEARRASARAAAAIGVAGPLTVAALLPDPRSQLALLADPRADIVIGAVATLVATAAVYLLLAWAAAMVLAALIGRAPGALGRAARRTLIHITPAVARNLVVTAAGLSLATGLAACGGQPIAPPSTTAPPAAVQQHVAPPLAWHDVEMVAFASGSTRSEAAGVPSADAGSDPVSPPATAGVASTVMVNLDWPLPHATSKSLAPADRQPADAGDVVVRRGDSLWSIAAAHLPPGAGAAQIDAAWRAWYRENRDIIGADPGLILPGQRLHSPHVHSAHDESGNAIHTTARPRPGGLR